MGHNTYKTPSIVKPQRALNLSQDLELKVHSYSSGLRFRFMVWDLGFRM